MLLATRRRRTVLTTLFATTARSHGVWTPRSPTRRWGTFLLADGPTMRLRRTTLGRSSESGIRRGPQQPRQRAVAAREGRPSYLPLRARACAQARLRRGEDKSRSHQGRIGALDEATVLLEQAVRDRPQSARAWQALATAYRQAGASTTRLLRSGALWSSRMERSGNLGRRFGDFPRPWGRRPGA